MAAATKYSLKHYIFSKSKYILVFVKKQFDTRTNVSVTI